MFYSPKIGGKYSQIQLFRSRLSILGQPPSEAINRIGATRTSIMGTLGPVITIILAVNILGEPFGWAQVVGLLLVLLGVSLLRSKR